MEGNKITDRIKRVIGVEDACWSGDKLTVYYYASVGLDTIRVRIAGAIGDANLQDAFETTLISL